MNRLTTLAAGMLLLTAGFAFGQEPRGVLYDFSATWCGPCQQVAPIVEKLAREGLPIRKVDIDEHKDFANRYHVESIPTFVLVIDGKEVDRVTGRLTEADLRRMVARIPTGPAVSDAARPAAEATHQPAAATPMAIPVELGEPGPMTRPQPIRSQPEETRIVSEEPRRGLREMLPFGRPSETTPAVVRGNDSSLPRSEAGMRTAAADPDQPADPMEASVRIRVITNGRIDLGSGTIISSRQGISQILTCAHIFKEFSDDSRIEVDLFEHGRPVQYIARLIRFDSTSDVGLISIPTTSAVPTSRVAAPPAAPRVGEPVAAVGCSGGEDPTRQQLRVTDIDKYDGPHNILCTGVPVRGRSGGGLFNRRGEIIGVCSAADEQEQRGFYSGLFAIHKLLDECSLTSLYAPATAPAVATASATPAPHNSAPPERRFAANDSVPPARNVPEESFASAPAPFRQPAPADHSHSAVDVQAGDAEVVVIIRDRSQPQAPNRVVIIHEASSKFFAYLSGELQDGAVDTGALGVTAVESRKLPGINRAVRSGPSASVAARSAPVGDAGKPALLPTTLSQPIVPQPYVRARDAR